MDVHKARFERYNNMKYMPSGNSGLKLPRVSLGLWHNFGSSDNYQNMKDMCRTAFDNGITHFDLANNYGPEGGSAETNFGRILNQDLGVYRDELVISTKAGYYMWEGPYGDGGSRKYMISSLDQSLKRMGLDYVDIFYHHRMTPDTPLEETMSALAQIVRSGKALYVGLSNYNGETMKKASELLKEMHVPFIINQNPYNIFYREIEKNGLLKASRKEGKGVICYSPLDQGILTDRYLDGIPEGSRASRDKYMKTEKVTENVIKKVRALNSLAKDRGQSLAEMALAWVLNNEAVTSVLIGASSPKQILDDIKCIENTAFGDDELSQIDKIALGN